MTKLWWKIHGWCGTYCGGFLAFVLITGGLAMLAPPIEGWENRRAAPMEPAHLKPASLSDWVRAAHARFPGTELQGINLPSSRNEPIRLEITNSAEPTSPFSPGQPWRAKSVFLHPSTGEILGSLDDGRRLSTFLSTVHIRLFAGTPGRNFVGLFGLALLVNTLTGLFLLGKFLRNKSLWLIRNKSLRLQTADLHMLGGTLLLAPALLFAITGFWLGMQGRLMEWAGMERPGIHQREAVLAPAEDAAKDFDCAAILTASEKAFPGLIPQRITASSGGQATVTISGRTKMMPYERLSQSVTLDKRDLSVLHLHRTSEAPFTEKLFFLQEGLHFGEFWGWGSRLPYLLIGILLGLLPISGYLIRRLRKRLPLRPILHWTAFSALYLLGGIIAMKSQGLIFTMAWGTVLLWTFVAGLLVFSIARGFPKPAL